MQSCKLFSRNIFWLHSVEKRKILSHSKKFRQINYLVISLVKSLISRNFGGKSVKVNFRNFHQELDFHMHMHVWQKHSHIFTL